MNHYLNLEMQRFKERLHVVYQIESLDFRVPPLSLQTLTENAVVHGIMKRKEGGTIIIHSFEEESAYRVEVTDDGVGFTGEAMSNMR